MPIHVNTRSQSHIKLLPEPTVETLTKIIWLGIGTAVAFVTFTLMWLLSLSLLPAYISKDTTATIVAGTTCWLTAEVIFFSHHIGKLLSDDPNTESVSTDPLRELRTWHKREEEKFHEYMDGVRDAGSIDGKELAAGSIASLAGGGSLSFLDLSSLVNSSQMRSSFAITLGLICGLILGIFIAVLLALKDKSPWSRLTIKWIIIVILVTIAWIIFTWVVEMHKPIMQFSTSALAILTVSSLVLCCVSAIVAIWYAKCKLVY